MTKKFSFKCKCGVKPDQHWHNKETGAIEGYITTIDTREGADVVLSEDEINILAEECLSPNIKNKKAN